MSGFGYAFLDKDTPAEAIDRIAQALESHPGALSKCERGRVNDAAKMIEQDDPHAAFVLDLYAVNGACV